MRICVFCGSNDGRNGSYRESAHDFGTLLAERGIGLVYGGASIGLMGAVADAAIAAGGEVIGVIPKALADVEVAHATLGDLRVVGSMHERKALMASLSDAFVAMPGGIGTLEELFEVWTWAQLGVHNKPCAILNVDGFFDKLVDFLNMVRDENFLRSMHRNMLIVERQGEALLSAFEAYDPPKTAKWITKDGV